ncbi:MAG: response regulator [Spirochaetales bacterium]|nr:response regulator [Spirochaetales bacterium]
MIRLIMADDEPFILAGLEHLMDWKGLGIEIVGSYLDGRSALEGILTLEPDIALLDISMPGFSGLELLERIEADNLKTEVIFISGFQEFDYVRSALLHGALDYLVKPVVRTELLKSLSRAKCFSESISSENTESRVPVYAPFFRDHKAPYVLVRSGAPDSESTSLDRLKTFSFLERLRSKIELSRRGFVFRNADDDFILFSGMSRLSTLVYMKECGEEIYRKNSVRICSVISEEFTSILDMENMIIKCREAYSCSYYASFFSLFEYLIPEKEVATSSVEVMKWREMLSAAILSLDEERINDCWSSFITEVASLRESRRDEVVFCFCNCLRLILDKLADSKLIIEEPDLSALMEKGREVKSYLELTELFKKEIFSIHHQLLELAGQKKTKEYLVALEYIEEHYMEQIGLKQIANLVGMNTYYFSAYFKKNTGENFKDYLRNVRLKHAVSLMISTDMSVTEVAQAVGYPDVRTFSDVFQRVYNEKPSAYIKRVRGK